jgi:hypothetical protein
MGRWVVASGREVCVDLKGGGDASTTLSSVWNVIIQ